MKADDKSCVVLTVLCASLIRIFPTYLQNQHP